MLDEGFQGNWCRLQVLYRSLYELDLVSGDESLPGWLFSQLSLTERPLGYRSACYNVESSPTEYYVSEVINWFYHSKLRNNLHYSAY